MRRIDKIFLHYTATLGGRWFNEQDILRWHTLPKSKGGFGWSKAGYHYVIRLDGTVRELVPEEIPSNGVKGHNAHSINIVYVGGLHPETHKAHDTRTGAQRLAMIELLENLLAKYPDAQVAGHYQFANKPCPGFEVPAWCENIGLAEKNICRATL